MPEVTKFNFVAIHSQPEMMIRNLFNMRRCVDMFNLQIVIQFLAPNSCLKVKKTASLKWHRHVGHHRNEIVRIGRRLSEAFIVIVVTKHADSLAAAEIRKINYGFWVLEHKTHCLRSGSRI